MKSFLEVEKIENKLIFLGVGQVASQIAPLAKDYELIGTTRDKNKAQSLAAMDITPLIIENNYASDQEINLSKILSDACVIVSFPPDQHSDKYFSSLCSYAKRIIYISSTSVYGNFCGIVDETTKVDQENSRSRLRLEAEQYWLEKGAIVIRAPGLYGPNSGLHLRLSNGSYRLPKKNDNYISRIHLQDLAKILLAALVKPLPTNSIYLVGDLKPATQIEVVQWLCKKMELPLPVLSVDETHPSLTANRRIDSRRILKELDMKLEFPTFKDGYTDCLIKSKLLKLCDPA